MELLELYLSPLDNLTEFKVIVTHSPAGEGESQSSLPFLDAERDWRITVIRTLEVSSFNPKSFSAEGEQEWMSKAGILGSDGSTFHPQYLVNIGQALYQALFPQGSRVEQLLHQSISLAESKSTKLLVQLKLEADVVQKTRLADYPWELLHNQHFFCHHQIEFSRYIAYQAVPPNLPTAKKLNVLLVSSGASDEELNLKPLSKKEQKAVLKGLKTASERGEISLEQLEEATLAELRTYLTEHPGEKAPHVLHFDGHGLFGKRCPNPECGAMNVGTRLQKCRKCQTELPSPQGYLVFEDEDGDADYISAKELGTLLQQSAFSDGSSQTGGVVLVVLSACQSGMAIAGESVFNGAAQNLIAHRVPAVVAMQYSVRVDSATQFAEQFYRSLGQKNSLAVAVSQGRAAMGVEGNQWYRPVLYLRWQDNEGGQLFTSATAPQNIPQNLPRSGVTKFVGREEDLENLHQQLQEKEPVVISSIAGMGGVGKTELALQYATEYKSTYTGGICWLYARDVSVGIRIVAYAQVQLGLDVPDGLELVDQVAYCWRNWPPGNVLIVLDDVTNYPRDVEPFLPPTESRFKVLMTTRLKFGPPIKVLSLDVLSLEKSLELLESLIGKDRISAEPEVANTLCQWLGYLPLGLELVGRYLAMEPGLSFSEMLFRLQRKAKLRKSLTDEALIREEDDPTWTLTAQRGVEAAFELSWERLNQKSQYLGKLLSLFAPAPIPWEMVEKVKEKHCEMYPENKEFLEEGLTSPRRKLLQFHLLQESGEKIYILHSLIREFFRSKLEDGEVDVTV